MELLKPAVGLLFWMVVVFAVLVFLMKKFAWSGIISALKEREGEIESALKMAEETRAEMAKLKSDNEKLIADARKERDQIIKEAKEVADKMVSDAKENAIVQGNKIMADAREAMSQEKAKMMSQIRKDVATISLEIAEKVLRKELSDKSKQESFVDELLGDVKLN